MHEKRSIERTPSERCRSFPKLHLPAPAIAADSLRQHTWMAKNCVYVLTPPGFAFAAQHDDGTICAPNNQVETTGTATTATSIPILSAVGGAKDNVVAASNGDPLITYPLVDAKKQESAVVAVEVMAALSWMMRTVDKLGNGSAVGVRVSLSAEKEATKGLVVSETTTADAKLNDDERCGGDGTGGGKSDVEATSNTSSPKKGKANPKPTFLARIMRELSFKREINLRTNKTQLEMKKMQLLISGYQSDVQHVLEQLKKEAIELDEEYSGIKQRMASNLTRLTVDGFSRQLIDTYRGFQLLLLQENKLQRAKVALRQTILQTRVEECDWMSKSVSESFQQQVQRLLSSQLNGGGSSLLDCGQQAVCQTLSPDDPFFATPDHLHTSNAQSKQLDLQLRSIAALIETMRAKLQELIKQTSESDELQSLLSASTVISAPSAAKRNSFKGKKLSDPSVLSARQKELRRVLEEISKLFDLRASGMRIQDDHALYNELLNAFARLVSDRRTRAGRLLAAFHKKLANDARVDVEITMTTMAMEQPAQTLDGDEDDEKSASEEKEEAAIDSSDTMKEDETSTTITDYYFPNSSLLVEPTQSSECADRKIIFGAIDVNQLPPPVWILAFTRFLQKVIAAEYALDQPLSGDADAVVTTEQHVDGDEKPDLEAGEVDGATQSSSEAAENRGLEPDHRITSERALEACVHHFVFGKLSAFCFAYEQSRFCKDDDALGCDIESEEHPYLQQQHWKHSKRQMQAVPWELLAFPRDVAGKIRVHFASNSSNDNDHQQQDSFLPQALHTFKSVECETTPLGVVRAVMIAFTVLHAELNHLLNSNHDADPTSFLSADVLIPSLVLMMSRLNHETELDLLWRRLNLVRVFESTLLSQGCEEAYYLTCLLGAMQVVQTFASSNATSGGHQPSLIAARKRCEHCKKLVACHHRHVTIKHLRGDNDIRRSDDSKYPAGSTKASSVSRIKKSKSRKVVKEASANPASSSSSLSLNEEAVAIENLSKWIASQALVDSSASASTSDLKVTAHELWLYERADVDELDT